MPPGLRVQAQGFLRGRRRGGGERRTPRLLFLLLADDPGDGDYLISILKALEANTLRVSPRRSDSFHGAPNHDPVLRSHENLIVWVDHEDRDYAIPALPVRGRNSLAPAGCSP